MHGLNVHRFRYAPRKLESLAYGGGILANLHEDRGRWMLVPPFMLSQMAAVARLVRKYNIDVIHAHWMVPQGVVAAIMRHSLGCPVVVSGHGSDIFGMRDGLRLRLLKLASGRADKCTTVSSALQRELRTLTGVNSIVIPMGVDPAVFVPGKPRSGPRVRSAPHVLFVGRLVEQKGVHHLIEAVAILRQTYPAISLNIVGDGPERPRLERHSRTLELSDAVTFLGAAANSAMPGVYRAADVFVLPSIRSRGSDTEGLSIALLEAASSRVPLVASRMGGITDVVEDRRSGLLVEPANATSLASAVDELLRNDELRSSMAQVAYERVVAEFSWEAVTDRFDALLRTVSIGRSDVSLRSLGLRI
jgi:glycosyltransferase involved in cell wall biosynthesis